MDKQVEKVLNELRKDKEFADCTEEELLEIALLEVKAKANYKNYVVSDKVLAKNEDKKTRTVKVSDAKVELFKDIADFLTETYENVEIVKENKLIQIKFDNKIFKLDLIEQRPPKK